ncbi:MAG: hypothetical protein HOQ05_10385 [Corynebacteriales bacterium]|nr:hypothetical protein [Mycobacteriales bacterium]
MDESSAAQVPVAFVAPPEERAMLEQRERLVYLLDRGVLVVAGVGVLMLVMALLVTLAGNGTWRWWVTPLVLFALSAAMFYGVHRLESRPRGAIEIPAEFVQDFADVYEARDEVSDVLQAELGGEFTPEDVANVRAEMNVALGDAVDAARRLLVAQRAGSDDPAERDAFYASIDHVFDIHEQFVPPSEDDDDEDGFESFTGRDL